MHSTVEKHFGTDWITQRQLNDTDDFRLLMSVLQPAPLTRTRGKKKKK